MLGTDHGQRRNWRNTESQPDLQMNSEFMALTIHFHWYFSKKEIVCVYNWCVFLQEVYLLIQLKSQNFFWRSIALISC